MAERRQFMELRGALTGELSHAANSAANVPLVVRVLSVPRMPSVQTVHGWNPPAPAVEATEAASSLPAAVESLDIPPRHRG
jgi:hypothetical protein